MTPERGIHDPGPSLGKRAHPNCIACGTERESGFHLEFHALEDGSVEAEFACESEYQGYPDMLHGGVITLLLDGAMTNCLFVHGHEGVTGELKVRFRNPVTIGRPSRIRGWIERELPPFYRLKAELLQDGQVKARATGKFVTRTASRMNAG